MPERSKPAVSWHFPRYFSEHVGGWIPDKFIYIVNGLEHVRNLLLATYINLKKTFPEGIQRLLDKANPQQDSNHVAFPGGPEEDIHTPIQDALSKMRWRFESNSIQITGYKISKKAFANLQTSHHDSKKWKCESKDLAIPAEVKKPKGKKPIRGRY